jgi:hypothetical protein
LLTQYLDVLLLETDWLGARERWPAALQHVGNMVTELGGGVLIDLGAVVGEDGQL